MKLKIKKQVEQEIEIIFPHYTKTICHQRFFKSENECIVVYSGYGVFSIEKTDSFPDDWMLDEQSTKEEFDAAYLEVLTKLQEEVK